MTNEKTTNTTGGGITEEGRARLSWILKRRWEIAREHGLNGVAQVRISSGCITVEEPEQPQQPEQPKQPSLMQLYRAVSALEDDSELRAAITDCADTATIVAALSSPDYGKDDCRGRSLHYRLRRVLEDKLMTAMGWKREV